MPALHHLLGVARIVGRLGSAKLGGPSTGGTMCMVLDEQNRLLLVKSSYRRLWGFPGGFLDPGEDPLIGAEREVVEETGMTVRDTTLVRVRPRKSHTDYLYIANAHIQGAPTTAWEIGATGWFPLDRMPELHPIAFSVLSNEADGLAGVVRRFRRGLPADSARHVPRRKLTGNLANSSE
jgi:ADP-ribose pyrophosphatase YjhB (NUDIX family)